MSKVGNKLTFPQHSFSWEVFSEDVAYKQLDKSAFLHNGTGVPAAITWFFGISENGPRFPELSLVFNERTFGAKIPVNNRGRYRLFWKNDFASALGQAFPDCLSEYLQGLPPNQDAWMRFEKVSATRYKVEFSTERRDASAWSARELRASIDAYLNMLRCHRDGKPFTKKDYYRDLSKRFGRTEKAFEYRFQNISHVLLLQGRDWVPGLRPSRMSATRSRPSLSHYLHRQKVLAMMVPPPLRLESAQLVSANIERYLAVARIQKRAQVVPLRVNVTPMLRRGYSTTQPVSASAALSQPRL